LPEPLAPLEIVIHEAPLEAVHEHPDPAVTVTVPLPAVAPTEALEGLIVYVQVDVAAAACVTVNDRPAIVTVPERDDVAVLAAYE
jgi:hypothetical protein